MVSLRLSLFSALSALALQVSSATSGCRCGDRNFLAFPRINLTSSEPSQCAAYKMIDARGTMEPQGVSASFQSAIQRLIENNTQVVSHSVLYPAGFDQNVTLGVQDVVEQVQNGARACPEQKYFLFGYSQGATVMLQALEKLDAERVAAVVLVGNPYRLPGRLSNVDGERRSDNRTAVGTFAVEAKKTNASIPVIADDLDRSGKVKDICLDNDTVCAFDPACKCQIASDHLSYGLMESVQDLIFDHVVSRF
ncbi:hypothetical protein CkaCkLH20_12280 [Colletotrichum karsti]|uniref:Cutinase n=1 Tax=Colletotrichum karsti TaxID=1095194 RepID=A0A9P6LCY7_9PEZI|nr:uncharacterized protein CkaCkLH20_12280 [Colletotrichum karsti]KAF9870194.1 hypothetical protein CkaCkLH20_12280 [Colletotrichum karsti]